MSSDDGRRAVDVSALVVNYNSTHLALDMLESLASQKPRAPDGRELSLEFVFVDNDSPDLDPDKLEEIRALPDNGFPGHVVLNDQNAGYAGGMNLAYEHARGEYVLVLNPDLVFFDGCVEALYRHLVSHPDVGAVGPDGWWENGREVRLPPNILPTMWDLWFCTLAHVVPSINRRYTDVRVRNALRAWRAVKPVALDMLSGACVMLPRAVIDEMGGFFDGGYPLYYEDTDLFRRIRALGKRLVLVPDAQIVHYYNRSGTTDPSGALARYWRARTHYYRKWYGLAGRVSDWLCRKLLHTEWARNRRSLLEARVIDLGDTTEPPTVEFGRHLDDYLIEVCQDAAFLLAAGMFGRGDRWRPGPSFWRAFGASEYYLRVVDLSSPHPVEVAMFRFRRVTAPAARVAAEPAPEETRVGQEV